MAARKRQLQPIAASEKDASAFRTISEVADELDVRKHVLRFWEGKFPQLKPMKRAGNRRLYRPEDLELLLGIKHLLHGEGYTIKGVQRILKEDGVDAVKRLGKAVNGSNGAAPPAETAKPARKPRSAAGAKTASTAPTPLRPRATQSVPVLRDAVEVAIKELEASRLLLLGDPDGAGTGKPMARGAARQR